MESSKAKSRLLFRSAVLAHGSCVIALACSQDPNLAEKFGMDYHQCNASICMQQSTAPDVYYPTESLYCRHQSPNA